MKDEAQQPRGEPAATSRRVRARAGRGKWLALLAGASVAFWAGGAVAARKAGRKQPPQLLSQTGLYADFRQHEVASRNLEYVPQYPLWTDGATKRRWVYLPPRTAIDGSRPEAWVFPVGTKFWKEFAFDGRRVETRYMERQADGSWLYAAYAWSEDEREAVLVADRGKPGAHEIRPGAWHAIPGVYECRICHQGQRTEVLGFSALQLSPDRDPNALHAETPPAPEVDLRYLVKHKRLKRFPRAQLETPPRIPAATPTERAALGYLHGNCGHCHNDEGSLKSLGFALRHELGAGPEHVEPAIRTSVGQRIQARAPGQTQDAVLRIEPGHPDKSVIVQRMGSRHVVLQMPPLGTVILDESAVALISRWVAEVPSPAIADESSVGSLDASQ